jgi:tRNA1(Val) A37 N6-methylase TrmN6
MANFREVFEADYCGHQLFTENVLIPVFGDIQQNWKESFDNDLTDNDKKIIQSVYRFGNFNLTLGDEMLCFDVTLQPNIQLAKSKVQIQQFIRRLMLVNSAALIVFHYPDVIGTEWRISFVYKERNATDSTPAKRYTYLVGKNKHCRTAGVRFCLLATKEKSVKNIVEAFNVETLTKDFYSELSNWYFWALQNVKFPDDFEPDEEVRNATSTIRLITRLMFVWFLKQKGLIPDGLFDKEELKKILNYSDKTGSTFYKAILQNLFFATLNTEMSGDKRKFINRQYGVQGFYRYERFFSNKERFLELTKDIPFLNGGLFENLDKNVGETNEIRIDCFSNKVANENRLSVPDYLFFDGAEHTDLNRSYGDSNHGNTKVLGLIEILKSYNFTIEENTPYEIEVALDPELLGKVFENLLASYNPETKTTARKQTGSFYTPREIVNYMVDESIVAYLKSKLIEDAAGIAVIGNPQIELFGNETRKGQLSLEQKINSSNWVGKETELEDNLRLILAYNVDENPFDAKDTAILIKAIDNCKILDPACGSGAFPMGVLQKMVHILQKLDRDNSQWRELQRQKAIAETEKAYNIGDKDERQKRLLDIDETFDYNASDYGRKLYLIENCIYGVDIQPIAVQIAKLRFFISLVCDQKDDKNRENLGIRPLPNLETKFVAANSLIGINRSGGVLRILEVVEKEKELAEVRHKHFLARTPETKAKYRKKDEELRHHIATLLKNNGWGDAVAKQLADWNPYDQNTSATFFDPEWMFGLSSQIVIQKSNVPSNEIKALNLQLESINKQIDTINLSLHSNNAPEILKLQFVSANIQVSIIELEVNRLKSNIDELYGSVNSKVVNVVKELAEVTYLINSLNLSIKQINKQIAEFEAKLKPVQNIENHDDFDIVIGNPPYVDIKSLPIEDVKLYFNIFTTTENRINLYSIFIEKGISLLNEKGVLCFINPNSILINESYKKIRKQIINGVEKIIKLPDSVFESATVETIIILIRKKTNNQNVLGLYFKNNAKIDFNNLIFNQFLREEWKKEEDFRFNIFSDLITGKLLQKISLNSTPLELFVSTSLGITPYDKYKGHTDEMIKNKAFHSTYKKDDFYVPLISGKCIHNYFITDDSDEFLKYGEWLGAPRENRFFTDPKIIVRQIVSGSDLRIVAGYSDIPHYFTQIGFSLISKINSIVELKVILAILNSYLMTFYHKNKFLDVEKVVFQKILIANCKKLPIKIPKNQQPFITLVDRILAAKKADPQADTLPWEAEIDARVFQLYSLTEEEMLQVLNSFPSVSEGERREEIQAQWHQLNNEK